jgi:outer membrane immunogenic protein
MRSLMLSSIVGASLALCAPVVAADMLMKTPPPAGFSWSGLYIGGNIGGLMGDTSGSVNPTSAAGTSTPFPLVEVSPNSLMGGGQIGYNVQTGSLVFGVEAETDAHRWSATRTATGVPSAPLGPGDTFTESSSWEALFLVRLGYAWDRTLLYGMGGVSWTRLTVATNSVSAGGSFSDSVNPAGLTVGGGLEYALTTNLSAAVEGRYTWYGNDAYQGGPLVTQTLGLRVGEVLGKLNWRF